MTQDSTNADSFLGQSAAKGAFKLLSGQALRFVIQLASIAVLARLVSPSDYGLFGMVLAVAGIGHILRDCGLSTAAIQAPVLTSKQRDNLFWLNSALGLFLMGLMVCLAPVLSMFFGRPEIREIAYGLAATFFISGMTTQYRADLSRRLKFGSQAITDTVSALGGFGVGVAVAWMEGGYWALVAQQVVTSVISLVMMAVYAQWLPGWYSRSAPMRSLFALGIPILGTQLVYYVSNNADAVLMGKFYGALPLGLYNRAMQIVRVPMSQLRVPLGNLSLSVLSRVQRDDRQLIRFVNRGQLVMSYPLLIVSAIFVAAASPIIAIFLGPGWQHMVPYLQLIAIGEGLNTLATVGGWIYTSRGLGRSFLKYTYVSAGLRLILYSIGAYFGPVWIAVGFAVAPVVLWPLSLIWVGRSAGLDTSGLVKTSYRIFAVCAFACGIGILSSSLLPDFSAIVELIIVSVIVLSAAGIPAFIPRVREDYCDVLRSVAMVRGSSKR